MSLIGFGVRRGLKAIVNSIIDNNVEDKDTAKALKVGASVAITAVGIATSILTADPVGLGDAVLDAAPDIAGHATEAVAHHSLDIAEHVADHGSHAVEYTTTAWDHSSDLHFGHATESASSYGSDLHFGTEVREWDLKYPQSGSTGGWGQKYLTKEDWVNNNHPFVPSSSPGWWTDNT